MKHVPIKLAKDQLTQLAREAEAGEHIVTTRNGRAAAELGPVCKRGTTDPF
jgi:antitoxin (DNA-binding transcriptional repressor) of toxin-antitoxin stability system